MIRALFTVRRHEEYGELGLAMKGRQWAEPFGGMAIAHDILEHFPKDQGTIEEELQALGASQLVRDHGDYFHRKGRRYTSFQDNAAPDLAQQVSSYGGNTYRLPRIATRPIDDKEFEEGLEDAWRQARRIVDSEDNYLVEETYLRTCDKPFLIGWMRRGYRRACRRYRGIAPYHLCQTFILIEQLVDKELEHAEEHMEVVITVDPSIEKVRLHSYYPEE